LKYESFEIGSKKQFALKQNGAVYPNFDVNNLFANGRAINTAGNTLELYKQGIYPGENNLSTGLRINYGAFSYYTGGDISGIDNLGQPNETSPEKFFSPIIGKVDVAIVNHHGNRDSQSPFFVSQLAPRVWIFPVWSSDHPGEDVLRRVTSQQLYNGPRDLFATSLLEANRLVIGNRIDEAFKATSGHVVIRVFPGGTHYTVFILNDKTTQRNIKATFDYQNN